MGGNNSSGAWRTVCMAFMLTITIFCIGGCAYMFRTLLTQWWIPALVTAIPAIALALPARGLWRWFTGRDNVALNLICHILFTYPLLLCVALTVNYATSGKGNVRENAIVERVYRETRYKTRRVSRKVYTRGAPYYVYCIEIRLPDSRKRDIEVQKNIYNRVSRGDTVGIDVSRGVLGMSVFNSSSLHLKEKHRRTRKETSREKAQRKYREHMEKVLKRKNND